MNGATQQLAAGVASYIGGLIVAQDAAGHIVRYDWVGYVAVAFAGRIRMHTGPAPAKTDPSP
jgi:hypothetical protein